MPNQSQNAEIMFQGESEMHKRTREFDWANTAIGPIEKWPAILKTTVNICLDSRYPIFLVWGREELTMFYNDAYRQILGSTKHPQYLGQSTRACWSEIWAVLGPLVDTVFDTGKATWSEKQQLIMERNQYREETYFTFSYSPIKDERGEVAGMFCACIEDTRDVLRSRRLDSLRGLTGDPKTVLEAAQMSAKCLAENQHDLPFVLIYLIDEEQKTADLEGMAGLERQTKCSPNQVIFNANQDDPWRMTEVVKWGKALKIDELRSFNCLPTQPWQESTDSAYVMPIQSPRQKHLAGILVAGLSPRREFDEEYREFVQSTAAQIGTLLARASAYEEEKKKADALTELDRAKTLFFSNVSHEFRTPLTLMLGPLQTAVEGEHTPEPVRLELKTAHRNGLRLLKLVNSLLDFSRIEAGRLEAVYELTDLATLTTDLASTFRSAIEKAGLDLLVDCHPLSQPAYIDRDMWEKIVLNLISNAFKFTLEGSITITLKEVRNKINLIVSDTGCGIADDEQQHIFERFHRAPVAKARTHEGAGIGLALVEELVKLHGGKIKVKSKVNEGTSFTVSIPAGQEYLPKECLEAKRHQSTAIGAAPYVEEAARWLGSVAASADLMDYSVESSDNRRNEFFDNSVSVLVADDNADMREYIERLLKPFLNVISVGDGLSAWETIAKDKPSLVITDVMMPGLDGLQLLKRIRETEETKTIPVIMLSARAGEESRIDGLDAGADEYLSKPFFARELVASVKTNLKLAQLRSALATKLEREVADRTADAEKANEELRTIAHLVSDQVQEPSNIIASYLKLLSVRYKGRLGKDADEFIDKCLQGSKAVSRMVDDLWHYSRADKPGITRSNMALEEALTLVQRDLSDQIGATKAQILKLGDLPVVIGNADQIEYVIKSLISNAIAFAKPGAVPEIQVSCVDNGHEWLICVQDNGIGIDSMDHKEIFKPFSRLNKRPDAGGTGMGLSIAQKIVLSHKGWMWVESEAYKGAKFFFTLPKTPPPWKPNLS